MTITNNIKIILVFAFFYLLIALPTHALDNLVSNNQSLKTYGCLGVIKCNDVDANHSNNVHCPSQQVDEHDVFPHRARVFSTILFEPNAQIYITECINTSQGLICTTGSSKEDKKLFCGDENATNPICDHYQLLRNQPQGYFLYPDRNWPGYTVYYSGFTSYSSQAEALAANLNLVRTASENERTFVTTDANGRLPIVEWQALTFPETTRVYAAFQILTAPETPTPTPVPQNGAATPTPIGGSGGQQQGTLQFATPTPYTPPQAGCQTVTFDPYGRVFDSVSLEPIPQAEMSLLQKDPTTGSFSLNYAQQRNLAIVNPQPTYLDGGFTFFVENGDYRLEPKIDGYSFEPQSQTVLGANANKIYSDMYYADSPAILQRGSIQHRDISLKPKDSIGRSYDIQIITQNQAAIVKNGKQMIQLSGAVSHPFAKADVSICQTMTGEAAETCNLYKTYGQKDGGPDKFGTFSFDIDQSELVEGARFKINFTKQDLNQPILGLHTIFENLVSWLQSTLSISQVQAQTQDGLQTTAPLYVEPIVSYIEGYAYDLDGNILPQARVDIHIPFAILPVYSTYADEKGLYRITSDFLPTSSYSISYISQSGVESAITTSQFLVQNNAFISSEKIDPMRYVTTKNNPRRNVTPSFVPQQKISPITARISPIQTETEVTNAPSGQTTTTTSRNPLYLVGAVLLILLGGAGVMLAVYVYKKQSREDESPKMDSPESKKVE